MAFITNIDTLQFSERLQKAGLERKIANELVETINEIHGQSIENLATKQDIESLRVATKQDLLVVKNELKAEISSIRSEIEILKKDIIIKLGTIMAGGVGIIAILIKF